MLTSTRVAEEEAEPVEEAAEEEPAVEEPAPAEQPAAEPAAEAPVDPELEKRKARAARFGIPLVEQPAKPPPKQKREPVKEVSPL